MGMSKNTSILLGDYFNQFINKLVESGKYASASEVVRAALRMFEEEQVKRGALVEALTKGEISGFIDNFDREQFLNSLHQMNLPDNEVQNQSRSST